MSGESQGSVSALRRADPVAAVEQLLAEATTHAERVVTDGPAGALAQAAEMRASHRAVADRLAQAVELARAAGEDAESSVWAAVAELLRLADEVAEIGAVGRLEAWERVHAALGRLADLGPVSEVVDRAAAEAAAAVSLDRAVLSRLEGGRLLAEAVHIEGDAERAATTLAALRAEPVQVDYPLVEGEVLRRRQPLLVADSGGQHGPSAHAAVMGWQDYVAVPILLDGRVIGFLHGDRYPASRPLSGLDRDSLAVFAEGYARVFERAVLRRRLRTQRQELRKVASWADARTSELSDRAITLATDREPEPGHYEERAQAVRPAIGELLTRREVDVLEHLVHGESNAAIAQSLVLSEGTVKFHVKNILRKMQVANRAEATSKYLHMKLSGGGLDGTG